MQNSCKATIRCVWNYLPKLRPRTLMQLILMRVRGLGCNFLVYILNKTFHVVAMCGIKTRRTSPPPPPRVCRGKDLYFVLFLSTNYDNNTAVQGWIQIFSPSDFQYKNGHSRVSGNFGPVWGRWVFAVFLTHSTNIFGAPIATFPCPLAQLCGGYVDAWKAPQQGKV